MKNFNQLFILFAVCSMLFISANGQKLSDLKLQAFFAKATGKTSEYSTVFKNLTVKKPKLLRLLIKQEN